MQPVLLSISSKRGQGRNSVSLPNFDKIYLSLALFIVDLLLIHNSFVL